MNSVLVKRLDSLGKTTEKQIALKNMPPNAQVHGLSIQTDMNQGTDEKGLTPSMNLGFQPKPEDGVYKNTPRSMTEASSDEQQNMHPRVQRPIVQKSIANPDKMVEGEKAHQTYGLDNENKIGRSQQPIEIKKASFIIKQLDNKKWGVFLHE